MDFAYASNGSAEGGVAAFIPLLLMGCIFGFFLRSMAKRKGRSQWLWFLAGLVPGVNLFGGIWLASLTDNEVLEQVKALISELQKFDFIPKEAQAASTSSEPQTWKCNCGITNDINVPNCPECGLKRDFALFRQKR